jgi:ankyrin repeat protein
MWPLRDPSIPDAVESRERRCSGSGTVRRTRRVRCAFCVVLMGIIPAAPALAGSVEGSAIVQLRSLIATNDAAGLYDFLNQPSLRGKIDSTPEVENIAIAAIRAAPGNRGGGSTRRRFFAALRGYRATEIFRYLIATYKSDLTDANPASGGLNYSILREDADNLLRGDADSIPHFVQDLTALMPLLPDLCAGQKLVEFLTVRPDAFAGIRDLYLRIGFEPTQACRDSGSSLTHALAKLHTPAATDAIVQRLHLWVEQRPLSVLRDQEIMDAISVLGDQPPEAQADLDAVERELAAAPWFFTGTRGQIKVLFDRQRDLADRSKHLPLQNLTDAIERGDVTSVKSLLESGADPNWVVTPWGKNSFATSLSGVTMLNLAILRDRLDIARLLVEKGADVNRADSNVGALRPLHYAADSRGNRHVPSATLVALLLAHGALTDARDAAGASALHDAVWSNGDASAAVAALLIKGGAAIDIDARDFAGYSPLAYAAKYGSVPALEALIAAGATPDGRISAPTDRDGKSAYNPTPWAVAATPLILAAAAGQSLTVTALLQHKADINATTAVGVTALRIAVAGGDPKMVALLLENGADLRATAPQAPAPLNLSLVALAQEEHERQKAVNPIGHLYVLDILAAHGLHSDPATTVKYAMEEAYLKCCYVPLSH